MTTKIDMVFGVFGGGYCTKQPTQKKPKTMYEDLAYIDAMKTSIQNLADKGVEDADLYRKAWRCVLF